MKHFMFTAVITGRRGKFICKDKGGGSKWLYLYIVKIDNFHPVLTPSISGSTQSSMSTKKKISDF